MPRTRQSYKDSSNHDVVIKVEQQLGKNTVQSRRNMKVSVAVIKVEEDYPNSDEESTVVPSDDDDDDDKDDGFVTASATTSTATASTVYSFDGRIFDTYQDMVDAKRQRNQQRLLDCGLIQAKECMVQESKTRTTNRPSKKQRTTRTTTQNNILPRRKSNRIAGIDSDGIYVEQESAGAFLIAGNPRPNVNSEELKFYNDRVNDGSDLSLQEAIQLTGPKWVEETSLESAEQLVSLHLIPMMATSEQKTRRSTAIATINQKVLQENIERISVNDDHCVAKITPDRIYSIVCHPSDDALLVSAGDKQGFVGLWNVDQTTKEDTDTPGGIHLFKVHSGPVCALEWTPRGDKLLSASYDGSVRSFDVTSQKFTEVFATYDHSEVYSGKLGSGVDGNNSRNGSWVQHVSRDHRCHDGKCFFLSTSIGTALHVDLRIGKGKVTFHKEFSEKKINTLSLHSNGYSLASAGLDNMVRLWDIRQLGGNHHNERLDYEVPMAVAEYHAGRSVNSAFFSPSGSQLVATTQMNTLDMLDNFHLSTDQTKPTKRVKHDNQTGRWLTTFNANWHPTLDIFVVGSMQKPRAIEIFDAEGSKVRDVYGNGLTAVASRCCFHSSTEKLIVVGGNSSGRVCIVR